MPPRRPWSLRSFRYPPSFSRVGGLGGRLERVLLVGAGPAAHVAARRLAAGERGVAVVGMVSDGHEQVGRTRSRFGTAATLGTTAELERICNSRRVDRVLVASPTVDRARLAELIERMSERDVEVSVMPWALDPAAQTEGIDSGERFVSTPARIPWAIKRLLDVAIAALALFVVLPVLVIVSIAIRLDSPGPVLFAHERVGRDGRRFKLYKLRTMVRDAEARVAELRASSAHPAWLLLDEDPRVTRLGRILRRTSIDELPQLWNVLRGDMSLVGPRPLPAYEDAHITGWGRRRLEFPPGITGLWQVLGRVSLPFEEMLKLDYLYVTNWTLRGDISILLRTIGAVLSRRGAN